jgi:hypothetical protein
MEAGHQPALAVILAQSARRIARAELEAFLPHDQMGME